jgi:glutamate dehydrogenase (NAD(P)+)
VAVDDLGPAKIVQVHEPRLGLEAALVVDNVARGPSIGGLRMAPDVSIEECVRLAPAMTLKKAAAALPHGGGKSVLRGDPRMPIDRKQRLVRAFAHALRHEDDYIFGPDMGMDETCMAWIKDEIGRAVGLPPALGGIPLDEIGATGWGIRHAAEVAAAHCGLALRGARVAIQGFSAVGKHSARFLDDCGAVLVAASDSAGTIHNQVGLDVGRLITLKDGGQSVVTYDDGEPLERDAILDVECIGIPAARPDVVREDNVGRLKARLVLQGANIPFTSGAEQTLHERGVVVIPDCIANAGGVICGALVPRRDAGGGLRRDRREDPHQHQRDARSRHCGARLTPARRARPGDGSGEAGHELPSLLDPLRAPTCQAGRGSSVASRASTSTCAGRF